jgi:1,2-diacylglycerol 3-alpha-glucosyltransferase
VRVVILTHSYPSWPGDSSGAEVAALARALMRRGIAVKVVAPGESPGTTQIDGVPVRWASAHPGYGRLRDQDDVHQAWGRPGAWSTLLRVGRSLRVAAQQELAAGADLVHAHGCALAGLAAPAQVPLVLTVQGGDGALLRRSRVAATIGRRLLQRATIVTAVSRQIGDAIQTLAGRFVGPSQIHPMPVESRTFQWTRGGQGAVVMARLTPPARVDLALEASAILASQGHQLSLVIIGDGPSRLALEQKASRLGISALTRFVGDLTPDLARTHLVRADLLLITAQGESTTLPALEALVSGVPVVACWDSGGAVEVVPESGAGRLSLPSPEAVAENVLSILADRDRISIGRLVGEAWRARLAPDHVAQICAGWYRDAVAH